jgi:hypothetical protein
MSRPKTKGVFNEIVPSSVKRAGWETFGIEFQYKGSDGYLLKIQEMYQNLFNDKKFINLITKAALYEFALIQAKCYENLSITFGLVKQFRGGAEVEYVIARNPFIYKDKDRQELRVYLGRTDELGQPLEKLVNSPKFMQMAEQKVKEAMSEEMAKTKKELDEAI